MLDERGEEEDVVAEASLTIIHGRRSWVHNPQCPAQPGIPSSFLLRPRICVISVKETLEVLYRDDQLVAVNKPAGLLVHRTGIDAGETRFAVQILRDQLGAPVYPVHRLDKPTSGVLLFGLDSAVARALAAFFANRQVRKTYLAIVRGFVDDVGEIDYPLKETYDGKGTCPRPDCVSPRSAVTRYRCLDRFEVPRPVGRHPTGRYSLVEVRPETGRRHQIRRHLKHVAHPIVGDVRYGDGRHNRLFRECFSCSRMLLAATEIAFDHPHTRELLTINAPLASAFASVIRDLRGN
jgi:tRNA pseudouridine65 synthase